MSAMSFTTMLTTVRAGNEQSQQDFAKAIGISPQYLCDLEQGRRKPSVAVVERICAYLGRGPAGRKEWHMAGAEAHGWRVRP